MSSSDLSTPVAAPSAPPALPLADSPPTLSSGASSPAARAPVSVVRIPIDKPQPAVEFLRARSRGVMDLIAHFWERLPQTPPLQRGELHLVAAITSKRQDVNISMIDDTELSGAMLFVPKAHRADVLALDVESAAAFASYIAANSPGSTGSGNGGNGGSGGNGGVAIDFLTGAAEGVAWMTPLLLPLVHKKSPARSLVNVVMQLPPAATTAPDPSVRLAREADVPILNRWRRQYKEERGILFDADMDAWIDHQRIFVYEALGANGEPGGGAGGGAAGELKREIVAVAKIDLDLHNLVEIGGVYTFPEFRNRGYGAAIVGDIAHRIRQTGKSPTLQVDEQNTPALRLYEAAGWQSLGKLARVWLTG